MGLEDELLDGRTIYQDQLLVIFGAVFTVALVLAYRRIRREGAA